VDSVIQNSGLSVENLEFIIIDNSQNFEAEWIEPLTANFILIEPGYNSGFARAVNMGLRAATKEFVCLMNQDASLITPNTFGLLALKAKMLPEKTILGCALQDENGKQQQSVWIDDPGLLREWRKGPINCKLNPTWQIKFENRVKQAHASSGFVHRINGAFLFWKKPDSIHEMFFDEDFFLYGEDIEWANRIKRKNWKFYLCIDVKVKHIGSASSSSNEQVKHKQIEIMDWLSILKLKGRIYLNLYLRLKIFNKRLDHYLAIRAKLNNNIIDKLKNKIFILSEQKEYFFKTIKSQNNHEYFEAFNFYKESLDVVE
jgi:GT2 family glycosyltransferase